MQITSLHARTPAARQPSRYPFIGVPALEYEGERFEKAYCLNMTYHKDRQNRARALADLRKRKVSDSICLP